MDVEGFPGTYGYRKGAQAHMGTGRVPGHIWTPEWCLDTYGHRSGAWTHMGTRRVLGHKWAAECCLGTYGC